MRRPPPPLPPSLLTRSPLLDDLDYTFAVMTFGEFPGGVRDWDAAERHLHFLIRTRTPFEDVSAASIWYLMKEIDNEASSRATTAA